MTTQTTEPKAGTVNGDPAIALVAKLPKDLREASRTLGPHEARFLVDLFYDMQENRIRAKLQGRDMAKADPPEPHDTLDFFSGQWATIELQLKGALDAYSAADQLGEWARSVTGVGPIIAAGLLAHIDIEKARTAGAIWRFAGLDPTVKWGKGEKRPWNASLKRLCWIMSDQFVRHRAKDSCIYGHLYDERKKYEVERDLKGGNAETARTTLTERKITDKATRATYESGHLPDGRLDLRARRYSAKLFLSHYQWVGWRLKYGEDPVKPYIIEHGVGHSHIIEPPNKPW